jgi:DNA-binding MarR family transcriptional regulator
MTAAKLQLDEFLPYRLSITSNLVSDAIAGTYEALFGLTIPQWRLIAVIAENDGISQQAIGVKTRMDKVTVSRAAIALAHRGLIERSGNPADRRSNRLVLSASGRALYDQVVPKALELETRIFGTFDQATLDGFTEMLRSIDRIALDIGDDASAGDPTAD